MPPNQLPRQSEVDMSSLEGGTGIMSNLGPQESPTILDNSNEKLIPPLSVMEKMPRFSSRINSSLPSFREGGWG